MVHIVIPRSGGAVGVSQQKEKPASQARRRGGLRLSAGVTDGRRKGKRERAEDETNMVKLQLSGVNCVSSSKFRVGVGCSAGQRCYWN